MADGHRRYGRIDVVDQLAEQLAARVKNSGVVHVHDDYVESVCTDKGKWIVQECDCNALRHYENWIVHNMSWILDFAGERARRMMEEANQAAAQLRAAAGVQVTQPPRELEVDY